MAMIYGKADLDKREDDYFYYSKISIKNSRRAHQSVRICRTS